MGAYRKFIASLVTAFAAFGASMLASDGDWKPALATLLTAVAGALVVWLVPNEPIETLEVKVAPSAEPRSNP